MGSLAWYKQVNGLSLERLGAEMSRDSEQLVLASIHHCFIDKIFEKYVEMNIAHPFREGQRTEHSIIYPFLSQQF